MTASGGGTIAIASCRRAPGAGPHDLYPDPDASPLQAALEAAGVPSAVVSWDDSSVAWEGFSRVVLSSTWDSVDRPLEYLAWARHVASLTVLVNDAALVEWNFDKVHQRELEAAGVPVIPTAWVAPGDRWQPPRDGEFVVKPSVSAGARSTARYASGDRAALGHVRALHDAGQMVMVQEYQDAIGTEGEVDIVFFDGVFSHAVKKRLPLSLGQGVTERPWERMAWEGHFAPERRQLAVAHATLDVVRDRTGRYPTYGRVDLVNGPSGAPLLMELELIDPYLSLDVHQAAAGRLCEAILGA